MNHYPFAKIIIAAFSLLVVSAGATHAQEKQAPPAGSEPRDFALPKIETYALRNGMKVTLVPFGRAPKATVRAVVRVGNLNDGENTWMADLTNALMKEGAGGKTASEIAMMAASMGGDFSLGADLDQTYAVMDVLNESAPDAIALIADVLQRPNLPEDQLEKVRADLIRNASVARTQAQAQASEAFYAAIYPDHPYGDTLPDEGQLESYTIEDVNAFYAENFGGARTHLYVVGQFDRRKVRRAIKDAFGKWESGPAPLILEAETNDERIVELIDRPGAPQSTIRLGKRVPPIGQEVDILAANTLLGGYFSSRITRNIREDKGYSYAPSSFLALRYKAANWQQDADVTAESTGAALSEILNEIRRLQNEPPSQAEVLGIKNYMNGIFVLQLASRGGVASRLSYVNLHDLGAAYLESYVGNVQSLTAEDFQNAAKEHLPIDEMSLVIVGPLDSVRSQLETVSEFAADLPEAN